LNAGFYLWSRQRTCANFWR